MYTSHGLTYVGIDDIIRLARRIWYGPGHQHDGTKSVDPTIVGLDLGRTILISTPTYQWVDLGNGFAAYIENNCRGAFAGRILIRRRKQK